MVVETQQLSLWIKSTSRSSHPLLGLHRFRQAEPGSGTRNTERQSSVTKSMIFGSFSGAFVQVAGVLLLTRLFSVVSISDPACTKQLCQSSVVIMRPQPACVTAQSRRACLIVFRLAALAEIPAVLGQTGCRYLEPPFAQQKVSKNLYVCASYLHLCHSALATACSLEVARPQF